MALRCSAIAACLAAAAASKMPHDILASVTLEGTVSKLSSAGFLGPRLTKLGLLGDATSTAPQQVHLSLAGSASQMTVTWVTGASTVDPAVTYSLVGSNASSSTVPAVVSTYTAGILGWSGSIYTATMTGLTAGAQYEYTVGAGDQWSEPKRFYAQTAPAPGTSTYVAVTADMGTIVPMGWAVADALTQDHFAGPRPFDLMLIAGDLSYATVDPPKNEVEFTWDSYNQQMEPVASTIPWMTTVGNHEAAPGTITNSSGTHNISFGAAFSARYAMPNVPYGGYGNFWYSYDFGSVHYVSISSEHPYTPGTPQWEWLQSDLAAADTPARRAVTPWIIFSLHRPLYSTDAAEWNDHKPGAPLTVALEPLLVQFKVDLVIQGHEHCAERTHSQINGTVVTYPDANGTYTNPGAPIYVLQGSSGAFQVEKWIEPAPAWNAFRSSGIYGYGRMLISGASRLDYEFIDQLGTIIDKWAIVKTA